MKTKSLPQALGFMPVLLSLLLFSGTTKTERNAESKLGNSQNIQDVTQITSTETWPECSENFFYIP